MKNFILMEKSKSGSLEMYTDLMDEEEDIKLEETF